MGQVEEFIDSLPSERRRKDARTLVDLMRRATGEEPTVDRRAVGFGSYHYRYASGHEGDAAVTGFAPAERAVTVYVMDGVGAHEQLLAQLGPHRAGVGCLYITDLDKIALNVLERIVRDSYTRVTAGDHYTMRARDGGDVSRSRSRLDP